jgi:hypothetical protein
MYNIIFAIDVVFCMAVYIPVTPVVIPCHSSRSIQLEAFLCTDIYIKVR